jgi:hypothetical protein
VKKITLSGPVHALHEISEEIKLQDILDEYALEILTLNPSISFLHDDQRLEIPI